MALFRDLSPRGSSDNVNKVLSFGGKDPQHPSTTASGLPREIRWEKAPRARRAGRGTFYGNHYDKS